LAVPITWQYNPSTDNWVRKADLPTNRTDAVGFTIGNKGYIVNGDFEFGFLRSLVEFDPSANTWTFKSLFPGLGRYDTQVFMIDGIAYAGGGDRNQTLTDFYKYDASNDTWTRILDIPLPNGASFFYLPHTFTINSTGYVGWENAQGEVKFKKYTPRICTQ
jgi:N-acetylneuraminic acid mutarotase